MRFLRLLAIAMLLIVIVAIVARKATPLTRVEFIIQNPPASTWDVVTFSPLDLHHDHQKFIALVHRGLDRHSQELIRKSGLRAIVFVDKLAVKGQARMAVPDSDKGLLYLDSSIGAGNDEYQSHAFHHELFHLLMGNWKGDQYYRDPAWIALNAPGASYGQGGASTRGSENFPLTHPAPGFINRYSQTGVEEDMAEIFACLMLEDERAKMESFAENDPVLRAKINYMKALVRSAGG